MFSNFSHRTKLISGGFFCLFFLKVWKDEYLTWDENEYGGVDALSFPADYIWTPSVECYSKYDVLLYYRPPTELQESNIFIDDCASVNHSVHRGGGRMWP